MVDSLRPAVVHAFEWLASQRKQCFGQLACRDSPPVWLEVGVLRGVVRALVLPWVVLFFAGMMSCGGVASHRTGALR